MQFAELFNAYLHKLWVAQRATFKLVVDCTKQHDGENIAPLLYILYG